MNPGVRANSTAPSVQRAEHVAEVQLVWVWPEASG